LAKLLAERMRREPRRKRIEELARSRRAVDRTGNRTEIRAEAKRSFREVSHGRLRNSGRSAGLETEPPGPLEVKR
jgi:hypothetical protein